ncbi:MAG: glutaminyl-peptide cyclotransferase, partial [Chitinophagaceae bacterium]
MNKIYILGIFFSIVMVSCNNDKDRDTSTPDIISFEVVKKYPHSVEAFTQGLVFYDGKLIESTGLNGASGIEEIDFLNHNVVVKNKLNKEYFGEGITILNNKIYQLTWQNKIVFVYNYPSYKLIQKFPIDYEGWGITHNAQHLIVSDGTSVIRYVDPQNFNTIKTITVYDNFGGVDNINELEFVEGMLYANRWQTNEILKIDTNGLVLGILDLSFLVEEATQAAWQADVLNGIAYNPTT